MNPPQFAKILANLEAARDDEARQNAIDDLEDIFYSANWEVAEGEPIIQMLVNMVEHETNKEVRHTILNAIEYAHGVPDRWKRKEMHLDLDPLVRVLKKTEWMSESILLVLGDSGQAKYRDVLAEYLNHPSEHLRRAAQVALADLEKSQHGKPQ